MGLVTVRAFRDPVEAAVARSLLEEAGIPSVIVDDHLVTAQWLYSLAIGGVKLELDARDLARAQTILAEDRSGDLVGIGGTEGPVPDDEQCPCCGSSAISSSVGRRNWAALSLFLGFPLVAGRRQWRCSACNHHWPRRAAPEIPVPRETRVAEQTVRERDPVPVARGYFLVLVGLAVLVWVQQRVQAG